MATTTLSRTSARTRSTAATALTTTSDTCAATTAIPAKTAATAPSTSTHEARIRREQHHEADVVVVGAGIFGCAIAFALANQGRSVLLLERWLREPDRIVGELLQPGGLAALRRLGLGHCVDGIGAIPCRGYNVIYHGEELLLPYPPVDARGEVPRKWTGASTVGTRPEGRGFHHGRFINQLRRACTEHPNITVVETEVVRTVRGEHTDQVLGVETRTVVSPSAEVKTKKADYFFGHLTIIADGYDSRFRKQVLDRKPVAKSKFYGLVLIDCPLPQPGYGQVIFGDTHPTILYQIGARETRVLFDVPHGIPEAAPAAGGVRGYLRNVAIPAMPACMRASAIRALDDSKIPPSMPNSWLPPSKQAANGMLLLGDAFNMRHPLSGGGMTVNFQDAVLLAEMLDPARVPSLEDGPAVRAAVDAFYWRRKNVSSIINVLAQALYTLFAATEDDRQLHALQVGCFAYLQRGITDGPCGLIGGIIQMPSLLAYHFFSVAFLALYINAWTVMSGPFGVLYFPLAFLDGILILLRAAYVFLPLVWRESFR